MSEEELKQFIDKQEAETEENLGAPLADFGYICQDCRASGKKSKTKFVSDPAKIIAERPGYNEDGQYTAGRQILVMLMICENGHEHIFTRDYKFAYDLVGKVEEGEIGQPVS